MITLARRRVLLGLAALPLGAYTAPVRAQGVATRTAVSVNLTSAQPDVVPFFYALQQRLFERAGLDLSYTSVASGSLALTAVLGSAVNIGFGNPYTLLVAYAKGAPLKLIAPGSDASGTATQIFVLPDSPIRGPKDLEGKVLGVTGLNDLNSIGTRTWVDAGGGDSSKLRFVEITPSTSIAAMQAKRIDVGCLFEPFRSQAIELGFRAIGRPYAAIARAFLVGAWFGERSWLEQHREAAFAFADALRTAGQYVDEHYDELFPLIASFTKQDVEVLRRANRPHFPPGVTPGALQPLIDVAARYKAIPNVFRAEDVILSR